MGSASSKFKKYLQHGDEFAAMQIFQSSPELRRSLDPNLSYGDHHGHNTALHYAARHGMKHLLRTFLADLGGDPNKRNARNESALHCACQLPAQAKSFGAQERRAACVTLLLQWKGTAVLSTGQRERCDSSAQDRDGNTPLHWAAATGLGRCVELLLAHGAPLFAENNDRLTPCDLAVRGGHHDIARLLEGRMVFADDRINNDTVNEDDDTPPPASDESEEVYSGLRTQDLQEAKDQLLVETSDMLHIPLFTAEALLRDNEWSREALLEKWMRDPVQCCQSAGVQAPASAFRQSTESASACPSPDNGGTLQREKGGECEICLSVMREQVAVGMSCRHQFCTSCWERYLTVKIQEGDAHHILCPAYQCHILVPVELIERLVSPEMARRYLQFDIEAFVESNRSIKWCPVAGCGRAVRLPETEQQNQERSGSGGTSHAVDCGAAHFFCWECLGEAHAPCGCAQWREWHKKIAEVKPEELRATCSESEDAANCLWLVTNSKPCPNCKSPIQKNEGCNHMKCSKCKFDFCWVCQESWKRHSSATGGYFRCNRFEAVHKADERQGSLINEATVRNTHVQELSRFLHYYTRFRNHENSQRLEQPLLLNVAKKMELLVAGAGVAGVGGARFVEDGVRELLKARRVLCGSYVYGYYLEDEGQGRTIFEFMQNELEEVTEKLSEMIARPYLRTPRPVIVQTTSLTRRKRHEFVRAVAKGLVPPETPPAQRKSSSWLPSDEYESDEDEVSRALAVSLMGECKAPNCGKPRARNPRTGGVHQYCSLKCSRQHQQLLAESSDRSVSSDYNMELVIALEMSRLQMIEDKIKQAKATGNQQPQPPSVDGSTSDDSSYGLDDQLRLAIQLSLQESTAAINRQLQQEENEAAQQQLNKTNADITVDCFLRSLANHKIDLSMRNIEDRADLTFKPFRGNEDGRFQISDIHENGYNFADYDDYDENDVRLRRSHSTGDLCVRRSGRGLRIDRSEVPRYHLDSDHSSQHDEKPEDIARRMLALPHQRKRQNPSEEPQSSVDDTTASDSLDMEVCGILAAEPPKDPEKKIHNPFASLKARLCSAHLPKTGYLSKMAVNKSIGLLSDPKSKKRYGHTSDNRRNSDHGVQSKNKKGEQQEGVRKPVKRDSSFSKSTSFLLDTQPWRSNLRIKICKPKQRQLETDSSNEYESETGIPKSPTLYISGVSISRTPEPKSPAAGLLSGRQSRSSSLSVPNDGSDNPEPETQTTETKTSATPEPTPEPSPQKSKAKSASEPEREREMFRFPKSSTDGALSSVLHVQESNLSSDDFHEALFLLERSPKTRDSKRRKKSKKKDKDERMNKEEASSAL